VVGVDCNRQARALGHGLRHHRHAPSWPRSGEGMYRAAHAPGLLRRADCAWPTPRERGQDGPSAEEYQQAVDVVLGHSLAVWLEDNVPVVTNLASQI
jgi:hypothetical protein